MAKLNFTEIFNGWNAATQKVFAHDRSQTVGASEVFDCLRKVFFKKRGKELRYTPDEDSSSSWGAAKRGDILEENYIVPALSNFLPKGAQLLFAGKDQKTLFKNKNSATPDGLIIGLERDALADYGIPDIKSDCIAIEMKTIDPRVGLYEEKAVHHGQAQIQLGLFRETTQYKPFYAVILYIDASFLDNIKPFVVEFDQGKWNAAQIRANTIYTYNNAGDIRPEGKIDKKACENCDFTRACSILITGKVPPEKKKYEYSTGSQEEVAELVAEIKQLEREVKEKEKDVEDKKLEIKEILEKEKTRKMGEKGEWSVSWYSQEGRVSIDTKAMAEDGIDLEPYKKMGNGFDVLKIVQNN